MPAAGITEPDLGSLNKTGTYYNLPALGQPGAVTGSTAATFTKSRNQKMFSVDDNGYSLSTTGQLSVEWWFMSPILAATGVAERIVSKFTTLGTNCEWTCERFDNGIHAFRVFDGTSTFLTSNSFGTPSLGVFHHYVATMKNTAGTVTVTSYLDSVLTVTHTFPFASYVNGTARLCIGSSDDGASGFPTNGTIDEVAIYGTELSQARVTAHYAARTNSATYQAAVLADAPVSYYRMGANYATYTDLVPSYDPDQVWNRWIGTRDGGNPQMWEDTGSQQSYGLRVKQATSLVTTDNEVLNQMQSKTGQFAQPLNRVESLTVMPFSNTADVTVVENKLGRELGDRITILETPPGFASQQSGDYVIQSISGSMSPAVAATKVTYMLWPASTTAFWVAGDATQSLAGISTRPGY